MQPEKDAVSHAPAAPAPTAAPPKIDELTSPTTEAAAVDAEAPGAASAEAVTEPPPAPAAAAAEEVPSVASAAPAEAPAAEVAPAAMPSPPPEPVAAGPSVRVDRPWAPKASLTPTSKPKASDAAPAQRAGRFGLLAASVAVAACVGALMGAAGATGIGKLMAAPPVQKEVAVAPTRPDPEIKALRDSVAQLRGQIRTLSEGMAAVRTSADAAGKGTQAQLAKLADTIDRLEKAQAEPLARLTKVAATVERLEKRETAAPEVTGSIRPAPSAPAAAQRPARPVVEGWRLHEVQRGVALVEGRIGLTEVMVGDTLRGVGRVEEIRREDGRWIVVTSRGVILPAR
jgi:hypothetical protein